MQIGRRGFLGALLAPLVKRLMPVSKSGMMDQINAYTLEYIVPKTADLIYKDSPVFTRLYKSLEIDGVHYPINQVGTGVRVDFLHGTAGPHVTVLHGFEEWFDDGASFSGEDGRL